MMLSFAASSCCHAADAGFDYVDAAIFLLDYFRAADSRAAPHYAAPPMLRCCHYYFRFAMLMPRDAKMPRC